MFTRLLATASLIGLAFLPCACSGGGGSSGSGSSSHSHVTGSWYGQWYSADGANSGTLSLSVTQQGSHVSGMASLEGSACFSGGTLSGSVSGGTFSGQIESGGVSLAFSGTLAGNDDAELTGTYTRAAGAGCAEESGTLAALRALSTNPVGTILAQPIPMLSEYEYARTLVVDPSLLGEASGVALAQATWGRLADVLDSSGALQNTNMVVGEDIHSDSVDFALETSAHTGVVSVRILHPSGTAEYTSAFRRLDQNLTPLQAKGLDPAELPPFTLLPRNAAVVLRFGDLLDAATITPENLRILTGTPPASAFAVRVIRDVNHGDLFDADGDGLAEFHPTRVILDTTVSELEAVQSGLPLATNEVGLPASLNSTQANVVVRIPTQFDPASGQLTRLANLAGHGLSIAQSGPSDPGSSTLDVVRAVRSGGGADGTSSDPNRGFLADANAPRIVGVQDVQISAPRGVGGDHVTSLDYALTACASQLRAGDLIVQAGVYAELTAQSGTPSGGLLADVHYRVLYPYGGNLSAGPAQVHTVFDASFNGAQQPCFASFSAVAPGTSEPAQGVSSAARVLVRFSEPMDAATLSAFDSMPILRVDPLLGAPDAREYVIGELAAAPDVRQFGFQPSLPFAHTQGSAADRYWLDLSSGANGPRDLAGNPLAEVFPPLAFTIAASDATQTSAGLVFRFNSADELFNDTRPEWRGQISFDFAAGVVRPRPVTRLRATCDRTLPVPGAMPSFQAGQQTPLSGLGSKLQMLWRYCDVGYALIDTSTYNLDVEHLYWAPAGGSVVADSFAQFEIRLSHTRCLPDESNDPSSLWPLYPNSGLSDVFDNNLLDPLHDAQRVVHPRERGYVIDPAELRPSGTGAEPIMPYPLNEGLPVSEYQYYTWRDTALQARGAVGDSPGAELRIVCSILYGSGAGCYSCPFTNFASTNPAPSIALPLLMEFRCFPDSAALGLNKLDVNLALNSSARPNFRAFSTGGVNTSGQSVVVDPDLEAVAHGGFNPDSIPPGFATLRFDNSVYLGEMDLVTRVSRMTSIWLDTQLTSATFVPPVLEPHDSDQPSGTSRALDFRAATTVFPPLSNIATDALFIDPYGNPTLCPIGNPPPGVCPVALCTTNGIPTFLGTDSSWHTSLTAASGARYFQARVTFVSNTETNQTPSISALGFAYRQ